jgi:hypothetical protein
MWYASFGGALPVYLFGVFSIVIECYLCKIKTFSFFGGEIGTKVGSKYLFFCL